jgi:DNA-binding transcriptional ArsR family regulator
LSGESRLKILYLLGLENNLCVNDIADILKSKVSGISHQLSILKKQGLVVSRKKQKVVYYSLSARLPNLASKVLQNCGV